MRSVRFPPRPKPAHHRGTYHVSAMAVRDAARANPSTKCWKCGLMAHEFMPHKTGKPARWTAGHVVDGQVDGPLLPECSVCAVQSGAKLGNQRSRGKSRRSRVW